MRQAHFALWNRLSFVARLMTSTSVALLLAGAIMLFVSTRQEARNARNDLRGMEKSIAEMSLLYLKVMALPACGSQMPLARRPLAAADIACIRTWIAAQ